MTKLLWGGGSAPLDNSEGGSGQQWPTAGGEGGASLRTVVGDERKIMEEAYCCHTKIKKGGGVGAGESRNQFHAFPFFLGNFFVLFHGDGSKLNEDAAYLHWTAVACVSN